MDLNYRRSTSVYGTTLGILTVIILSAAVSSASAQRRLPDLVVSNTSIQTTPGVKIGLTTVEFIKSITVTVKNICDAPSAASYVLVTFKKDNSREAKPTYFIGNTVGALKPGETFTQTFALPARKIVVDEYIYIEADPYKKVAESDEANNWRTLSPNDAPASTHCTQK